MIVSLVSSKQMLRQTSQFHQHSNKQEDLLVFACQSITHLLTPATDPAVLNRILAMLLDLQSKKARQLLAHGIQTALSPNGPISESVLALLASINTIKKGTADVEYDLEKVLAGIQSISAESCAD